MHTQRFAARWERIAKMPNNPRDAELERRLETLAAAQSGAPHLPIRYAGTAAIGESRRVAASLPGMRRGAPV